VDAENPRSLRFVVAGGGENFLDIFVFPFAQVTSWRAVGEASRSEDFRLQFEGKIQRPNPPKT